MTTFDHQLLVRRDPAEVKKFRGWLLGAQAGEVRHVSILHEADKGCCHREPWRTTEAALVAALRPTTMLLFLDLPGVDV